MCSWFDLILVRMRNDSFSTSVYGACEAALVRVGIGPGPPLYCTIDGNMNYVVAEPGAALLVLPPPSR